MAKNQHVVRRGDGSWAVRGDGNKRDTSVYRTQREAIDHARQIAIAQASDLVVHGSDGRIRQRSSYGHDAVIRKSLSDALRRRIVPFAHYLEARNGFRSDAELAAVLGMSADQLTQLKRGGAVDAESERLMRDLALVVSELLTIYRPEAVPEWLQGRPPNEPKSPLEWLREGNLAEVLHLINASATGAYS